MYRWTLAAVLIVTACGFQSPEGRYRPMPRPSGAGHLDLTVR